MPAAAWRERLLRAVTPGLDGGAPAIAASLDIWVTPPEYTGLAPQFLRPENRQTIRIPIGSTLLAQVHGGGAAPDLAIDGKASNFDKIDKEDFRAQATLKSGQRIEVSQAGAVLGSWPIEIIPDNPPTVAFAKPPEPTVRQALRFDYRANDDYGVESVKAVIRRGKAASPATGSRSNCRYRAAPQTGPGNQLSRFDGPSLGRPAGRDPPRRRRCAGPDRGERAGAHEIAGAGVPQPGCPGDHRPAQGAGERPEFASGGGRDPRRPAIAPAALRRTIPWCFWRLRVAQQRLRLHKDAASIAQVEQLLWDTALRIEDGGASLAENELRRLQRQLQDALAKNAPDQEIDRLMSELRQALDRYLQALAENMARNPDQNRQPLDQSQRVMTSRDLERMLDRARELAQNGQREQARQLLSELQNMLENLRTARPGQGSQQGANQAQQMMRGMREMMQRQQQLLDRSFHAQQQADQGQMGRQADKGKSQQTSGRGATGRQRRHG